MGINWEWTWKTYQWGWNLIKSDKHHWIYQKWRSMKGLHSHICKFCMWLMTTETRSIQSQINVRWRQIITPRRCVITSSVYFRIKTSLQKNNIRCTPRWNIYVLCSEGLLLEPPISIVEYMRIQSTYFPPDIISIYHIDEIIAEDGYIFIKIFNGMYVLKQAAIIAYNQLTSHMDPDGYYPVIFITGYWHTKPEERNFAYVWIILE